MEVLAAIVGVLAAYGLLRLVRGSKPNSDAITQFDQTSLRSGEKASTFHPVSWQSRGKSAKSQESPHSDAIKQRYPVSSRSGQAESAIEPVGWQPTDKAAKSQKTPRWIAPGGTTTVAGREIGGMLYLGPRDRRESLAGECKTFIDSGLSVAELGSDIAGESLPYWPSYSDISPRARATYLDWLASGRADNQYGSWVRFPLFLRT